MTMRPSVTAFPLHNTVNDTPYSTSLELVQLLGIQADDISPEDELGDIIYPAVCTLIQDNRTLLNQQILLQRDIDKLVRYLDQIQHDIIMVEESRAWRIGFKIMSVLKTAMGRPIGRHAFTNIHRILTIYHHWKKARD